VAAAVQRYASTGEGEVTRLRTHPSAAWIRVSHYKIRLRLDHPRQLISVLYVCPSYVV